MTDIDLLIYILTFAICIFWTSLALREKITSSDGENFVYDFIAGVFWFVFGGVHTISAVGSNFLVLGYVWYLMGAIFFILGLAHSIMAWNLGQKRREWD